MIRSTVCFLITGTFIFGCGSQRAASDANKSASSLEVRRNDTAISIFRTDGSELMLTQVVKPNERPYLHPITAPDGKGVLTQYRPSHHPHQTGVYWGLKMVNGRDYFMKWQGDYWRQASANVITKEGTRVSWQTVYDMLDGKGETILTETADWSLQEIDGKYLLDLEWKGLAKTNITFGKFYVGGLFIRMPWHKGAAGEVVNAAGQRNHDAEGQRAIWTDVGIEIRDRKDWGHMAVFDHPDNNGFPISWRVDNELGIGPSRQITGDWKLATGDTEKVRYRIVIYTGDINPGELTRMWKEFSCTY